MKESIFSIVKKNLYIIILVSLVATLIYLYTLKEDETEYFIPHIPSMNEFYIHRVKTTKNLIKPNIKYIMAIPFGDNLASKNNLWNMIRDCGASKQHFPDTFIFENFYDLQRLKDSYSEDKIYILKKNIQRKQGIKLFKGSIDELNHLYNDGRYKVIQEFVREPYLVYNRIIVLRLYLVILRHSKYEYYIHNYGKCLYTSKNFSLEGLEEERMITQPRNHMDDKFPKNIDEFCAKESIIKHDLYKPIKIVKTCFSNFIQKIEDKPDHNRLLFFQIFGVDLILDKNKYPKLLEINKDPDIKNFYYKEDATKKKEMMDDLRNLVEKSNENHFTKI